jgi:hypothetical protein
MVFFSNLVLIKNQLMLISYEKMRLKKKNRNEKDTRNWWQIINFVKIYFSY